MIGRTDVRTDFVEALAKTINGRSPAALDKEVMERGFDRWVDAR